MESNERPPQIFRHLEAGFWPWILPNFHDQRAKIIKNHKIKNTPSILISFKIFKKLQKNQKSGNFVFSDDFRGRWAVRKGINHFLKNVYLRVTDGTRSGENHYFSWGDRVFLFLGTWKVHFYVFLTLMQFCFEKTLKKHWYSIKIINLFRIEGKIEGLKT